MNTTEDNAQRTSQITSIDVLELCVKVFTHDYRSDYVLFSDYFELTPYVLDDWNQYCNDSNSEEAARIKELTKKLIDYINLKNIKFVDYDGSTKTFNMLKSLVKYLTAVKEAECNKKLSKNVHSVYIKDFLEVRRNGEFKVRVIGDDNTYIALKADADTFIHILENVNKRLNIEICKNRSFNGKIYNYGVVVM